MSVLVMATGLVVILGMTTMLSHNRDTITHLESELHIKNGEVRKLSNAVTLHEQAMETLGIHLVENQQKLSQVMTVQISSLPTDAFGKDFMVDRFKITAYSPFDNVDGIQAWRDGSVTRTGTRPGPGTFAVDPKVIPLGSHMIIIYPDGTMERGVALDTGGKIKKNRADVFRWTYKDAMKFGVQDAVVIWFKGED